MKGVNRITYYDFADINYSSFFLSGFLKNQTKFDYEFAVSHSVPPLLREVLMDGEWRKILSFICLFKWQIAGGEHYFCIDLRDSSTPRTGMGYHIPLLEKVRYYFKVNHNLDDINNASGLRSLRNKIIPAYPFFPIRVPRLLPFLPIVTPSSAMDWPVRKAWRHIKGFRSLRPLEQLRRLRDVRKDLDIFFVIRISDQEHHHQAAKIRMGIVKELRRHSKINAKTGIVGNQNLRPDFWIDRLPRRTYLHDLSRAKLAIYVRGLHDCISFKFGELLALGKPIVGQTIVNNTDIIYSNPHFDEQFAYEAPKEIVAKAAELLAQPEKLAMLSKSNAEVFDSKFVPEAAVSEIIEKQLTD